MKTGQLDKNNPNHVEIVGTIILQVANAMLMGALMELTASTVPSKLRQAAIHAAADLMKKLPDGGYPLPDEDEQLSKNVNEVAEAFIDKINEAVIKERAEGQFQAKA